MRAVGWDDHGSAHARWCQESDCTVSTQRYGKQPIADRRCPTRSLPGPIKDVAERDGHSAARVLRLDRLPNALAVPLAMSGAEPGEKRMPRAEERCSKQQRQRRCHGTRGVDRIRGHFEGHTCKQQARADRQSHGDRAVLVRENDPAIGTGQQAIMWRRARASAALRPPQ
jgi:hypothetical protein